eukprot:scaffold15667_cov25-Prasinocladus_malaysianus.AAC.1
MIAIRVLQRATRTRNAAVSGCRFRTDHGDDLSALQNLPLILVMFVCSVLPRATFPFRNPEIVAELQNSPALSAPPPHKYFAETVLGYLPAKLSVCTFAAIIFRHRPFSPLSFSSSPPTSRRSRHI